MTPRRLEVIYVEEPLLEFRYGQRLAYPRDGLFLFGPVDAEDRPRPIRFGVIGTPAGTELLEGWCDSVAGWIDVPPRTRGSKLNAPHHVPFPGFAEAFSAQWPRSPARVLNDIDEADLRRRMNTSNRHEAVKASVDLFVERLTADQRRDEDPPQFWYVVIPEFVFLLGRPKSVVPVASRVPGLVSMTAKEAATLRVQPTLFGEAEREAEVFEYLNDFRRQLKARLLDHQIVTQIVRESTLLAFRQAHTGTPETSRRLEDRATVAWKLCTTSYYKSGGKPWQLAAVRAGVCYVGLAFKAQPISSDSRWSCCAAQMFMADGEGIVFRGALGPWFNEESQEFHLDRDAAEQLGRTVIAEYSQRQGTPPAEVFIHAKAAFTDDEWDGFSAAGRAANTNVVGVQISDARQELKLYRQGAYPTIRGTTVLQGSGIL